MLKRAVFDANFFSFLFLFHLVVASLLSCCLDFFCVSLLGLFPVSFFFCFSFFWMCSSFFSFCVLFLVVAASCTTVAPKKHGSQKLEDQRSAGFCAQPTSQTEPSQAKPQQHRADASQAKPKPEPSQHKQRGPGDQGPGD